MNKLEAKITRRKPTLPPFECKHCGLIGYNCVYRDDKAKDIILCLWCRNAWDVYLFRHDGYEEALNKRQDTEEIVYQLKVDWINNPANKPAKKTEKSRFHRSVPLWLKKAILAGAVSTNDDRAYTVFSQGTDFVRVEIASSLGEANAKLKNIQLARLLIRMWSKPTRSNHYNKGWLGVAPSYLATELDIDYDEAAAILKDLEEEGFIYDNSNGNHDTLPDGRTYATRYYMTGASIPYEE